MITGRDAAEWFQFQQHLRALRLQRDTGLKHSKGSVLRSAQAKYDIKSRTIAGAVTEMEALEEERYGVR